MPRIQNAALDETYERTTTMPEDPMKLAAVIFDTVETTNDIAEHYTGIANDFATEPTLTREFAQVTASLLKLNASLVKKLYEENAAIRDRLETLLKTIKK